MAPPYLPYLSILLVSALVAAVVVSLHGLRDRIEARRADHRAVQAAHLLPTPRLGGLALAAGLVLAVLLVPQGAQRLQVMLLIAAVPVFVSGLVEDLGWRISPRARLLAAAFSGALALALLGPVWIDDLDLPGSAALLQWAPLGIGFTVLAVAGMAHGFNLIDGLNGLSAGVGIIAALGLAAIAAQAGQAGLVPVCLALVAALMGFLALNFPWGQVFLGDAGAYALGHMLAVIAVLLVHLAPDVSSWAVLLVFFWPVADTVWAVLRRRARGQRFHMPDRLHAHHLAMRGLEILVLGRSGRHLANPLATLLILPLAALPAGLGVVLWNRPAEAFFALWAMALFYAASYALGLRAAQRRGRFGPAAQRA